MDTADQAETSPNKDSPKRRKQRLVLSCGECRRLKLKCDKGNPCSSCVRRGYIDHCSGVESGPGHEGSRDSPLQDRVKALERLLSENGISEKARGDSEATMSSHDIRAKRPRLSSPVTTSGPAQRVPANHVNAPHLLEVFKQPSLESIRQSARVQDPPVSGSPSAIISTGHMVPPHESLEDPRSSVIFAGDTSLGIQRTGSGPLLGQGIAQGEQSIGTLVIGHDGRSKYLGPTAASEWLMDSELAESGETPAISRMPSPETKELPDTPILFPFSAGRQEFSTQNLLSKLPPRAEATVLMDAYYRYFAWQYDIAPRPSFQVIFDGLYERRKQRKQGGASVPRTSHQELALCFMILALGALYNLEVSSNDPLGQEFAVSAYAALVKGNFMNQPTVAGIQALNVMAHYHLETEEGRNGDSTWPLWGLAMRLIQAMGLHRDGAKWHLPLEIVEQRRRVFWECQTADVFQANCYSRPNSIGPHFIDTAFPSEPTEDDLGLDEKGFFTLKFELSKISSLVVAAAMYVDAPPYSRVIELHNQLIEFQQSIPFRLRCRSALQCLTSLYPDPASSIRESPEPSSRDLRLTFQQTTLSINVSETVLFLHRQYFVRALHEHMKDPLCTVYGQSYLAVVERCSVIIRSVADLHKRHKIVSCRHWFLWYHTFNSAVCLGTLVLNNPQNVLAPFAMVQIDAAITAYTSAVQTASSPRHIKNLQWLLSLRARAQNSLDRFMSDAVAGSAEASAETPDDPAGVELVGWRTRLIQRLGKGSLAASTVTTAPAHSQVSPSSATNNAVYQAIQELLQETQTNDAVDPAVHLWTMPSAVQATTDQTPLHQYWDPMLLNEFDGGANVLTNWWNIDHSTSG